MKYLRLALALFCFTILVSQVMADSIYGAQVFKTPTKQEALLKQEELLLKGYSPILIARDGAFYKVIIGSYPDVLTPKWVCEKLKGEMKDAEIVAVSDLTPIEESLGSAALLDRMVADYPEYFSSENE